MIYGSGILFQMMGCEWLFRGLEKFRFLAASMLVCRIIALAGVICFVKSDRQIVTFAICSVLAGYGYCVLCFLTLRKYVDLSFDIHINTKHFKPLLIFFLMSCAVSIYSSLDLTMLGFMKTDYETGLYNLAAKGKSALAMTGGVVWSSVLPRATQLWKDGEKKRFEALAQKTMALVFGIQFTITVICLLLSRELMIIIGGELYLGSVTSFRILLLSLVPIGFSNILGGQVLIPAGMEEKLLHAEIAGAVFNFLANLVLIPVLSITGAAITTTVSEIIVWLICLYFAKKELGMDFVRVPVLKVYRGVMRRISGKLFKINALMADRIMGEKLPLYCPCCDTHLRSFINGGFDKHPEYYNHKRYLAYDQKVICPVCGSLPRHRILVSWFEKNMDCLRDKRILHFAQERSVRMWMDRNGIKTTTADLYNAADLKINIEETGLPEGAYDLIICNHVLEHVSDYKKALKEMHRILSVGGKAILSFPVDMSLETVYEDDSIKTSKERLEHFGQADHLRIFGKDSPVMLEKAGFSVSEIRGQDCSDDILPVIGPADYDYDVLWVGEKD